jgi:Domain of unknown function (DUF3854)
MASFTLRDSRKPPIEAPVQKSTLPDVEKNTFLLDRFCQQIEQEFIEGSAIAPSLYKAAIHIVSDTEMTAGGEARYPIDEAFNWQPTRFGQQSRAIQYAALLTHENGWVWQGKLWHPRIDKDKTRKNLKQTLNRTIAGFEFWSLLKSRPEMAIYQKYETPVGKAGSSTNPQRAIYLPPIPLAIRRKIARRYGILDPAFAPNRSARKRGIRMVPFWDWIAAHPEIPIIWTEGGKKALCLLSPG